MGPGGGKRCRGGEVIHEEGKVGGRETGWERWGMEDGGRVEEGGGEGDE